MRIRETATGRLRAMVPGGERLADMTSDNKRVVTSGNGSTAEVFAVEPHEPTADEQKRIAALIEQLTGDRYDVREAADAALAKIGMLAEPQLRAASDHRDAEVRVRCRRLRERVLAPAPVVRLRGNRGDVEVVCFSPDDRLIATACRGGDIKIWDAGNYGEIMTLTLNVADTP